jgi:glyoxylase-like metal-dependent hydrolase (beta-lactamase superfamily II)
MPKEVPMLTRRSALLAAAALPFATALPGPLRAQTSPQGPAIPQFARFRLGTFEVTPLLAGTRTGDKPQETFGMNVPADEFAAFSAQNFIPADRTQAYFTPVVVNDGTNLILFDTGLAPEGTTAAMAAAGLSPDQITHVVLTHMHPDHIGGLMGPGGPTFANAAYVAGAVEHNFWSGQANEGFDTAVRPLSDRMTMLDDGGTVAPGITAMMAAGHTPGHMIFMLDSGGQQMAITADTANHYVWSLAKPDWEVRFDADKAAAAATRRTVFGMLAADRVPFIGYHMPFPALGFVEAAGDGFRYVPASYQFVMDA